MATPKKPGPEMGGSVECICFLHTYPTYTNMSDIIIYVLVAIVAIGIGAGVTIMLQRRLAKTRAKSIIEEAHLEANVIKQNKLLEAREEELKIKGDAERQANQRMQKIQSIESKMKQREMQLNQQQSENQRARNEIENTRANLEAQQVQLELRKGEVEKMRLKAQEELEHISGLSSEEAKERLVESLKDEAKTAAASYINDIMDEAKLTANKEAKRIVVQTIQRVATETAIEIRSRCSISTATKSRAAS